MLNIINIQFICITASEIFDSDFFQEILFSFAWASGKGGGEGGKGKAEEVRFSED